MSAEFRRNNFDLIRLFAATQVAVHHAMNHMELSEGWMAPFTPLIPGVPIFFFVSGLLISRSYQTNSQLSEYALNRGLRIYPALIVCTVASMAAMVATGYLGTVRWTLGGMASWMVAQVTFFQFYNPDFMRGFGSGVLNGSLWTISVELQFYVLVPILYPIMSRMAKNQRKQDLVLVLLTLGFLVVNILFQDRSEEMGDHLIYKLLKASFIPWFYMFLLGVLVQRNFVRVQELLAGRALTAVPIYLLLAYAGSNWMGLKVGNQISPALFVPLAAAVFACAYSLPDLSHKLLNRNDISYGVYIYHMPVVNVLMYFGYMHNGWYVVIALAITAVLASASWFLIERPAMRLKKHPLMSFASSGERNQP